MWHYVRAHKWLLHYKHFKTALKQIGSRLKYLCIRSSVVTRMKMLGIEFYCGNYDELRRMKELGGVETHCSRCKLISEQDLVKLLLCFYRFTALPRGKVYGVNHLVVYIL